MSIAHTELNTSDTKAAKKFYAGVFGWKFNDVPMPGGVYTMVASADGKPFGGLQQNPMPGSPSHWLNYVTVPNIKRTVAKAEKRGGKALGPIMDIPGMGKYAMLQDPTGGVLGVWQEAAKPKKKTAKKAAKKAAKAVKKTAKKAAKKVKKTAKAAKRAAKKTAKAAKKAAKKTTSAAKKAAKRTAKTAARGTKRTAKAAKRGAKTTAKSTASAAKRGAKRTAKAAKRGAKRTAKTAKK